MKCFFCNAEVRWNNDFDTEDTYPDSDHLIVSRGGKGLYIWIVSLNNHL